MPGPCLSVLARETYSARNPRDFCLPYLCLGLACLSWRRRLTVCARNPREFCTSSPCETIPASTAFACLSNYRTAFACLLHDSTAFACLSNDSTAFACLLNDNTAFLFLIPEGEGNEGGRPGGSGREPPAEDGFPLDPAENHQPLLASPSIFSTACTGLRPAACEHMRGQVWAAFSQHRPLPLCTTR